MDLLNHLLIGFENAVTWTNLLYCFVGVTLGTLVGVLPGMGPVATVAMLLPSRMRLTRPLRSSCSQASITARSTAALPPPFWSTSQAKLRQS